MRTQLPSSSARMRRYWKDDYWRGDQGFAPHCVGFSWTHWLEAAPVRHNAPPPVVDPAEIYHAAQLRDEWPGIDYDGTSVRAGAKVLKDMGFISAYYWARQLTDMIVCLLEVGPVVVGTDWYSGMSSPDSQGYVHAKGRLEGGHAYLITGVSRYSKTLRICNSWGPTWGRDGRALITFADMAKLIRARGEICLAKEIPT